MKTRKLLVGFDLRTQVPVTGDFLIPIVEGDKVLLFGTKSHRFFEAGMMVYVGMDVEATDILDRLAETRHRSKQDAEMLPLISDYIAKLQDFKIGNILKLSAAADGLLAFEKVANSPPPMFKARIPS